MEFWRVKRLDVEHFLIGVLILQTRKTRPRRFCIVGDDSWQDAAENDRTNWDDFC